jgi:signal transduction histidine kinase
MVAILGHLFHGKAVYGASSVFPHNEMAVLTASMLLILSAGCMAARPDEGALATLSSARAGGIAARRLLAGLFAMGPLVVLLAIGARLGWYSDSTAGALIVFLGFFEAVAFVLRTAGHLNRLDEARMDAQRLRDEVIAMTSHELRNPLTMALVSASALEDESDRLSGHGREVLALLEKSIRRMARLVDDFLDVEKLESGGVKLRLERLELGPLLAETIAGISGAAAGRVALRSAEGLAVTGDRDRLIQVVINLVSNALKFSPAGAPVEVEATARNGQVRVSVKDRGPGIPVEFQSRIFQRFARSAEAKAPGSGLGLYISRTIIEKLGGRIGFETKAGEGTAFFFELPTSGL